MYETTLVQAAQRFRQRDADPAGNARFPSPHRPGPGAARPRTNRELTRGAARFAYEVQRPQRPGGVQVLPQPKLMRQTIEAIHAWRIPGGEHGQPRSVLTIGIGMPSSAEDAFTVFPQNEAATLSANGGG